MNALEIMLYTKFLEETLPKFLLNNETLNSDFNRDKSTLENSIKEIWNNFCNENNVNKDSIEEDFSFIYAVRLKRNKQLNIDGKLFLIKIPINKEELKDEQESFISAGILITDNGVVKFFALRELADYILPARYIKKNQNYLLYEIDKNLTFKNWGTLLNPKNLSDVSEAMFLVGGL